MMRQAIALFDEYQRRENGKQVLRAMKENPRQGFYNGSRLPLGYALAEVDQRGHRTKKKLVTDPVEADAANDNARVRRDRPALRRLVALQALAQFRGRTL